MIEIKLLLNIYLSSTTYGLYLYWQKKWNSPTYWLSYASLWSWPILLLLSGVVTQSGVLILVSTLKIQLNLMYKTSQPNTSIIGMLKDRDTTMMPTKMIRCVTWQAMSIGNTTNAMWSMLKMAGFMLSFQLITSVVNAQTLLEVWGMIGFKKIVLMLVEQLGMESLLINGIKLEIQL